MNILGQYIQIDLKKCLILNENWTFYRELVINDDEILVYKKKNRWLVLRYKPIKNKKYFSCNQFTV